jgi:putative ABC transport system substrate-binding protein
MGGAAVAWPLAASGQHAMPRIGVLLVAGPELMGPFPQALRDLGYVEGKNIQAEMRSAEGNADRLPGLAAELVRSKVDVIVASQTPAIIAARNATLDIPIVMAPAGDPVALGSLATFTSRTILPLSSTMQTLVSLTETSNPAKWSMLRFSF